MLRTPFDVSVTGLVAGVQEALPGLKKEKGSVLITGGGLSLYDPKANELAVAWGAMGLAIAKAAQHKAAGVLHQKLAGEGVYVGWSSPILLIPQPWAQLRANGPHQRPRGFASPTGPTGRTGGCARDACRARCVRV